MIPAPAGPITLGQLRDAWDEVLQALADEHRAAWMLVSNTTPMDLRDGDVLVLGFQSDADVQRFRDSQAGKPSVADLLRTAIRALLGIEVKYIARPAPSSRGAKEQATAADDDVHRAAPAPGAAPAPAGPAPGGSSNASVEREATAPVAAPGPGRSAGSAAAPAGAPTPALSGAAASTPESARNNAGQVAPPAAAPVTGWVVAAIPSDAEAPPEDLPEQPLPDEPEPDPFSFVSAPDAPTPVVAASAPAPAPAASGPSLDELARSAPAPEPELSASQAARYGESVVREELGAELIEERPRVRGER